MSILAPCVRCLSGLGNMAAGSAGYSSRPYPQLRFPNKPRGSEAFPGQTRCIILTACSGSTSGSPKPPMGGAKRHSNQMPVPPYPAPFHAKKRLYFELSPEGRALFLIPKAEPSHPTVETHFNHLYSRSYSFGHYPKLISIGEGLNIGRLVNLAFRLSSFFTSTVQYNARITADAASIRLSISYSIFPSLMNKIPSYLNSFAWGSNSLYLERGLHRFPAENHGLRLGGVDSNTDRFTLSCKPIQCMLKVTHAKRRIRAKDKG